MACSRIVYGQFELSNSFQVYVPAEKISQHRVSRSETHRPPGHVRDINVTLFRHGDVPSPFWASLPHPTTPYKCGEACLAPWQPEMRGADSVVLSNTFCYIVLVQSSN